MTKSENMLYEGACCYAVANRDGTCDVVVFSSSCVTHKTIGTLPGDRAEILCRRMNAYPVNTRRAYELL
jgi:hypothetical protein